MSVVTHSRTVALERVYVWQLPTRVAHWVLFSTILVLSATGYYIGHPFITSPETAGGGGAFVMGTARLIHLFAAILFFCAMLIRFYWGFAGNRYERWNQFVPLTRPRIKSFIKSARFYSFLGREPHEYSGHNALAALTYAGIYAVYAVMLLTGLALYTVYAGIGPFHAFDFLVPVFGGLQMARLIHHIGMWVILIFAVAHVHFVLLSSIIDHVGIFDSIFSGYKFMPKNREEEL